MPEERRLVVRAGFGWPPGVVGVASVGADLESPGGFALRTGKPVISNHLGEEDRFRTPELLVEHGIHRAMNVILQGDRTPFGVLEVDSRSEGEFVAQDIAFLQSAANILGMAIERLRHERRLKEALERQRFLLQEINHRVKKSLGIVSSVLLLKARTTSDDVAQLELEEASDRINIIALAHEALYHSSQFENLDIGAYLKDVCAELATPVANPILVSASSGVRLSTDRAILLALIVVELVNNAVQHAYAGANGSIQVTLEQRDDALVAFVQDGGCGLPDGFPEACSGLGMRIVQALTTELGGKLTIRRLAKGSSLELRLPLEKSRSGFDS
jgi:two-component sensor histidine kinase